MTTIEKLCDRTDQLLGRGMYYRGPNQKQSFYEMNKNVELLRSDFAE